MVYETFAFKNRFDSVIGTADEHDASSERIIAKHPVFGDGFGITEEPKFGPASYHKLLSQQVLASFMIVSCYWTHLLENDQSTGQ